jgi:hypothetical protein
MSKTSIIIKKLNELIEYAKMAEPNLAARLTQIEAPIKKMKDGEVTSRKYLLKGLEEILADCEVWLSYISMNAEEQVVFNSSLSPIEKYWYFVMFTAWFKQDDKRFHKWREHLIKGTPPADDYSTIVDINKKIDMLKKQNFKEKYRNAALLDKLIADKAMVTDFMIMGRKAETLCVQLTQSSQSYTKKKESDWQDTLIYWNIKRGLFVRYNPRNKDLINTLLDCTLSNSDFVSQGEYKKVSV